MPERSSDRPKSGWLSSDFTSILVISGNLILLYLSIFYFWTTIFWTRGLYLEELMANFIGFRKISDSIRTAHTVGVTTEMTTWREIATPWCVQDRDFAKRSSTTATPHILLVAAVRSLKCLNVGNLWVKDVKGKGFFAVGKSKSVKQKERKLIPSHTVPFPTVWHFGFQLLPSHQPGPPSHSRHCRPSLASTDRMDPSFNR